MVVLPVPGGPHRIIDDRRWAAAMRAIGPPSPSRWSWPTTSESDCGRRRSARGAAAPPLGTGGSWRPTWRRPGRLVEHFNQLVEQLLPPVLEVRIVQGVL